MERRNDSRVPYPVLVTWRGDGIDGFDSAYGYDLSTSGLGVTGAAARLGAVLDLQLVARSGRRPLEVLAEVIRVDDAGFGVRFLDLDDAQQSWLADVVRTVEAAPPLETEDLLAVGIDEE